MKVSKEWLKELVNLTVSMDEVERILPLKTIGTKEITDKFIELDMKGYNRADLLSMRGVAYEIGAITNSQVSFTELDKFVWEQENYDQLKVEVEDLEACPTYCLVKIEGLKVAESPKGWKEKLESCGMRSINNIADITNLVMLEYGQPLHSFDAQNVANQEIIVRKAKEGEEIETLDSKKRILKMSDLVIADAEKALGIAGVMGGKNSEITEKTTEILLEAAIFDPLMLRETSQRLGLNSEASKRFYHGLTRKRLLQALDKAIKLYQEMGGKVVSISLIGDFEDVQKEIQLRVDKTNSLIGVQLEEKEIKNFLQRLNFKVSDDFLVTRPYFRLDIEIEEDLIEEVARMYGYEKIPAKTLPDHQMSKTDQKLFEFIAKLKQKLVEKGLVEIQSYSYFSTIVLDFLGFNSTNINRLVKLSNPISSETEYLRTDLWPNLVKIGVDNLKRGVEDVAIFEVGKVYLPQEGNRPEERVRLGMLIADKSESEVIELYFVLKETLTNLGVEIEYKKDKPMSQAAFLFHPNKSMFFYKKGEIIGGISEIHPRITDKLGSNTKIGILEIDISSLLE